MQPQPPATELSTVLTRMQDMLLSQEHAAVAVHQLAQVARNLIPSAAGAGVSRIDARVTGTSTRATDHLVEAVDALQYELGDGPCLSAWATMTPQRIHDTSDEDRWPTWCVAAARSRIRSVLSIPLRFRDRCLGTMKVYATVGDAFTGHEEQQLGLLAAVAATVLGSARTSDAPQRLSTALRAGLQDRQAIDRATGMLMEQRATGSDQAHAVLLAASRVQGRPMAVIARQVLEHRLPPQG